MIYWSVFLLHGVIFTIDEVWYHRRREMPRWERWGHPLDTLTVLVPFSLLACFPELPPSLYIGLAVFSSLFVTKDEWVHKVHSPPGEQWLHAVMYLLHPVLFFVAWQLRTSPAFPALVVGLVAIGIYQVGYWNFYR